MPNKNTIESTTDDIVVRKNPGQSVAVAFGPGLAVGLIVGLALREMKRKQLEEGETSNIGPTADIISNYPVDSPVVDNYNKYSVDELLDLIGGMPSLEEQFKGLFIGLPEGYEARQAELSKINQVYRQQVAEQLAPSLNAHIQGMEHETLDQKKELSRWVNDQLEPFGLAVQCPNTGRPAKLRGMTGGSSWPDTGRFCFETHHEGKREKSSYSETLPELTLTDATPSQEPETPWQAKVGPKTRRQDRKRS